MRWGIKYLEEARSLLESSGSSLNKDKITKKQMRRQECQKLILRVWREHSVKPNKREMSRHSQGFCSHLHSKEPKPLCFSKLHWKATPSLIWIRKNQSQKYL